MQKFREVFDIRDDASTLCVKLVMRLPMIFICVLLEFDSDNNNASAIRLAVWVETKSEDNHPCNLNNRNKMERKVRVETLDQ